MRNIFVYGSLMAPSIWNMVVRGSYRSGLCTLKGFSRRKVKGEDYPGLAARPDSAVEGLCYFDVTDKDAERLDLFEGDEYALGAVIAEGADGKPIDCWTYLFKEEYAGRLDDEEWSFREFLEGGMERFIRNYKGWKALE